MSSPGWWLWRRPQIFVGAGADDVGDPDLDRRVVAPRQDQRGGDAALRGRKRSAEKPRARARARAVRMDA